MDAGNAEVREERRIVTAVFVDVVGSTSITEHLDPEDARDVIGGAQRQIIEQIDLLGGTVKDLAGDGVLALFGAPEAHEDDALRAVLAGIRICDCIAAYASGIPARLRCDDFAVRVGIETGRAALGLHGAGSRLEYGATGDVINTAARLQGHAMPGQVLVGALTRSMTEDHFLWSRPIAYELKGKDQPVQASVALRHVPRIHDQTQHESGFVGRTKELRTIRHAVEGAFAGEGALLALIGDAGIGKTRLVEEAHREYTTAGSGEWLEAAAASYASTVPYSLFRDLMLQWLNLPLDSTREQVRQRVVLRAESLSEKAAVALRALNGHLTGQPDSDASGRDLQDRTYAAYGDFFAELAGLQPVVIALEDLHWSDSTSIDLARHLVSLTARCPLVMIVDSRPEHGGVDAVNALLLAAPGNAYRLSLQPLMREDDRALLRELLSGLRVQPALEESILDTTDGNPFFVQEQARSLLDAITADTSDGNRSVVGLADVVLQPTVERALMSRIDRLSLMSRQALLAASVLGRRFEDSILQATVGFDISDAVAELASERFVRSGPVSGTHEFSHALVQEAAYASLARKDRRLLHARAASAIESAYRGREAEVSATLGNHFAAADQGSQAVRYLNLAAKQAAAHNAHNEAVALVQGALRISSELSDRGEIANLDEVEELTAVLAASLRALSRYDEAIDALNTLIGLASSGDTLRRCGLIVELGQTLSDAHRYDQSLAQLDRAEELLTTIPFDDRAFAIWLDLMLARGSVYYWLADHASYQELLNRVRPIIEARADRLQRIRFYNSVRASLWRKDHYVISSELLHLDEELFQAEMESSSELDRAWAQFHHGFTLMWHGALHEAESLFRNSLKTAEELESTMLRARSLTYLMVTARLAGDVDTASELVPTVSDTAAEVGLPEYKAMADSTAAWVCFRRGESENARSYAQQSVDQWSCLPNRYPLDWLARLPLLAVDAADNDFESVRTQAKVMLSPGQQELPAPLTAALRRVVALDDDITREATAAAANVVVTAAEEAHYL